MRAITSYDKDCLIRVRDGGESLAVGRGVLTVCAADFIGDRESESLQRIKLEEVLVDEDNKFFSKLNGMVGQWLPVSEFRNGVYNG